MVTEGGNMTLILKKEARSRATNPLGVSVGSLGWYWEGGERAVQNSTDPIRLLECGNVGRPRGGLRIEGVLQRRVGRRSGPPQPASTDGFGKLIPARVLGVPIAYGRG
jgi:hypothetical protein